MPHLQQVQLRLNVLTFLLRNSPLEITAAQAAILWDTGVADVSVSDTEREKVYTWLKDACARRVHLVMEADAAQQLFTSKMSNATAAWCGRMTPEGFTCFSRFFILTNESLKRLVRGGVGDGNMDIEFAFQLLQPPTTLEGFDSLWNILLHASDEQVVTACVSLLNSIHENLAPELIESLGQYSSMLRKARTAL